MAGTRIELVGGPFDGKVLHPSRLRSFLFIDGSRCWQRPGEGRHLYGREAGRSRTTIYLYEGYRRVYCRHCGGFNAVNGKPVKVCTLCGKDLVPHSVS